MWDSLSLSNIASVRFNYAGYGYVSVRSKRAVGNQQVDPKSESDDWDKAWATNDSKSQLFFVW